MPNYRRWRQPGGTYFFTVNLRDRQEHWLVDRIDQLRQAMAHVRRVRPFGIRAWVVLPDHLHMIWTLPKHDDDFSTRWRLIKSRFSRSLPKAGSVGRASLRDKGERGVWQRRFFEHLIRDEDDLIAHVDYIHFNPVKHRLVDRPTDWPHSSIHRFIERGILDKHWGTDGIRSNLDLD